MSECSACWHVRVFGGNLCIYTRVWLFGCMWKCVCVCAHGYPEPTSTSRPTLMKQQKHTLYYSKAQHYSWPNSMSLLLWELLDSFPILWSCIVCVCLSVIVYVWWFVFLCETLLSVFFRGFFPWRENDWSPECVINPIFTLSSHLNPALTGLAYSEHYPT